MRGAKIIKLNLFVTPLVSVEELRSFRRLLTVDLKILNAVLACLTITINDEFFLSNSFYHKFKLSNFRPPGLLPFAELRFVVSQTFLLLRKITFQNYFLCEFTRSPVRERLLQNASSRCFLKMRRKCEPLFMIYCLPFCNFYK